MYSADAPNQLPLLGGHAMGDVLSETMKGIGRVERIPGLALQIMLLGILIPTALYAFNLRNPAPEQLLVAVCMSLFSAVVFLWILDSTSILRFRSEWVSRSVYGAAIASVLGTSAVVYRDAIVARKYPLEGAWELTITGAAAPTVLADVRLVLAYSDVASAYWGYSNLAQVTSPAPSQAAWVEVRHFRRSNNELVLRLVFPNGSSRLIKATLKGGDAGAASFSAQQDGLVISMERPPT